VLSELLINQCGERQRASDGVRTPHPIQCPVEGLRCVALRDEPASLHSSRATPTGPIPVPPKRSAARPVRLHRENLTLLCHHRTSSIDNESRSQQGPVGAV
jgi:hypothetical protein